MYDAELSAVERLLNSPEFQRFAGKVLRKSKKIAKLPKIDKGRVTPSEAMVRARLEKEGYYVLRNGWPDFVAIKGCDIRFIEVKTRGCKRTPNQAKMNQIFKQYLNKYIEIERPL